MIEFRIMEITRGCNKNNTGKIIFLIAGLLAICLNSSSQFKKNAVVLDLAGKAFSIYDISYERYFGERFHLGLGMGLEGISVGYARDGKHKDLDCRFPVYGGLSFGKKKHHIMTELGITFEEHFSIGIATTTSLWPFVSGGYEFRGDKIILRVPVYLTYVGPNLWFPSVLPWAGVSIGVPF